MKNRSARAIRNQPKPEETVVPARRPADVPPPFPPRVDFSSLSLRDLLDARDAYHVHLSHMENVVATAERMEDPAAAMKAAARLAGVGEIELPAFGPFALPPADAIAIAADRGGERLAVTVEVFPSIALLARVAGTIASNPVLRGGSTVVSGRPVRIAWQGSAWMLTGTRRRPGPRSPRAGRE